MDLGLSGKVALVVAASSGLGRACARALAREGAELAVCSRTEASISAAAEEIGREAGRAVLALAGDVRQAADCDRLVAATVERFGRLDILVNNAGGPPPGPSLEMTDEQWQAAFETNLLSTVRLTRAAVPHLRRSGGGRVLNIVSSSVREPIANLVLSNALRAGVVGFAKTLARELGPDGILVNNVAPGRIATERLVQVDRANAARLGVPEEAVSARSVAEIPLGRYGEPEEFGAVVAFLASARASYVSGQTLFVDGGMTRSV